MKVITTNLLNRFWKNGVLPIKTALAGKLDTAKVINNLLTTAAGYALDARQGKILNDKITELNSKLEAEVEDIPLSLNTSQFSTNATWAQRRGREVKVYPLVAGVPVKGRTIATGLPAPSKIINIYSYPFGQVSLSTSGILSIASAGGTTSTYMFMPFTYWAAE